MGLSFTIAAGPSQRSHSLVRVPWDSLPYFTVSDSRLPHTGGPGPRICIPHEQRGPVIPPGTGFPFPCHLRLTGLRWRYSSPPPHGVLLLSFRYSTYRIENSASNSSFVACVFVAARNVFCLTTTVFSGFTTVGGGDTAHRQQCDLINPLLYFQNKVSGIQIDIRYLFSISGSRASSPLF
jgi:hypothetical protein